MCFVQVAQELQRLAENLRTIFKCSILCLPSHVLTKAYSTIPLLGKCNLLKRSIYRRNWPLNSRTQKYQNLQDKDTYSGYRYLQFNHSRCLNVKFEINSSIQYFVQVWSHDADWRTDRRFGESPVEHFRLQYRIGLYINYLYTGRYCIYICMWKKHLCQFFPETGPTGHILCGLHTGYMWRHKQVSSNQFLPDP